jgi:hypothetical protein
MDTLVADEGLRWGINSIPNASLSDVIYICLSIANIERVRRGRPVAHLSQRVGTVLNCGALACVEWERNRGGRN